MENIKLELTMDEANMILAALGDKPYIKVADLIQKIQQQGAAQLQNDKVVEPIEKQNVLADITPSKNGK